jgi:hypothetical protein
MGIQKLFRLMHPFRAGEGWQEASIIAAKSIPEDKIDYIKVSRAIKEERS